DALDPVGPPLGWREERALVGLHRVGPRARVAVAEEAADGGQGAAAALRGDERPPPPAALLPDLGAGPAVVRRNVVGVVELTGNPVARRVAHANRLQAGEGEVHVALTARCEHEVGAVGAHDLLPLVAHALGHHDRALVALDRRDEGARDPAVAGGALEDPHAPGELTARLSALEHVEVDPVLKAPGGAVPLELQEDLRPD